MYKKWVFFKKKNLFVLQKLNTILNLSKSIVLLKISCLISIPLKPIVFIPYDKSYYYSKNPIKITTNNLEKNIWCFLQFIITFKFRVDVKLKVLLFHLYKTTNRKICVQHTCIISLYIFYYNKKTPWKV